MIRQALLWAALLAGAVLTAAGIWRGAVLTQELWTLSGWLRFVSFSAAYWALAALSLLLPRRALPATVALAALAWTLVASGPLAVSAVLFLVFATASLGLYLSREPVLAMPSGVACLIFAIALAAHLPVNFWWTYLGALAAVCVVCRSQATTIVRAVSRVLRKGFEAPPRQHLAGALLLWALLAHLAIVPKPEIGADALGMHLVIPARVAETGLWQFDVREMLWAVMPMGGDWLYTAAYLLGGEAAARLANFVMMLSAVSLVYALARLVSGVTAALLAAALFASTPLVQLVTGSLFVENTWTALILAAVFAIVRAGPRCTLVAGLVAGSAVSAKFGALAFALPLLAFLPRTRAGLMSLAAFTLSALPPYLGAWLITGNPIFPYANGFWKSPLFDPVSFTDHRFEVPLRWPVLWDLTFHTERYLEGRPGAFGFAVLCFLPLVAITLPRWPRALRICAVVAATGFVLTFLAQSYLRYVYPAVALFAVLAGYAAQQAGPAARIGAFGVAALQMYFLPASGWMHRGFFLNPVNPAERTEYIEESAPSRFFVEQLNRTARGQAVALFRTNQYAGLAARAYTDMWHHANFVKALSEAEDPAACRRILDSLGIRWLIMPRPPVTGVAQVALSRLLNQDTQVVAMRGKFVLARLRTVPDAASAQPVPPGDYDNTHPAVTFEGPWAQADNFAEAFSSTEAWCDRPGATVALAFRGREVTWSYAKAPNRGRAVVTVDRERPQTIDLYSPGIEWRSSSIFGGLAPGEHTIRISVSGEKNNGSNGTYVDVDRFSVR